MEVVLVEANPPTSPENLENLRLLWDMEWYKPLRTTGCMQWFDRKSNNGYGYGQYTALDVLQAKKSCEKRSIMSNYAKKKKVPGWSFSRSFFFCGGGQ